MRKIAIITGTRAEFGLLSPLIDKIQSDKEMQLQLIVTAMHLSPEFGYTVDEIEKKGYKIDKKVECLLSSDSAVGITKSIGLAMIGFADALNELSPDLVIILGDRTEMLAAATTAMVANIPIAHIHGGETTEGAYDESIRHAITKMSFLHFASTEVYKKRIIQLGEHPDRVFNVGGIGLDSINNLELLNKEEFEKSIDFQLGKNNILITFHPVTLENQSARGQFQAILDFLNSLHDTHFIFTHANSDKNGRVINQMIEEFVNKNKKRSIAFKSLGQLRYLSALKYMDLILGNSSSGICEVPSFNIPTINIGDRQKGRILSESVIQTEPNSSDLSQAFAKATDPSYLEKIKNQKQLYGSGNTAEKIMSVLRLQTDNDLKKAFHDIQF
ncbi:UDP-N-acetylglucosamine 2-epimerase [Gillisia limnaea]|uniref:UDP-N-acetyl-D-glucosamine 2-epimerase, UDP-hydrolysing n=1 Tax=Gillisia limnaea (strain DSM 15749 / LMG 21470 / R-8282) TaxID=865937 RepID=H2BS81_GILLR|nr:UDP-N-acetylglucosamine 2-epimerase [Gillisia limnaea]EHQ01404.1 UDP-N-acetyl-D-glucosamine 2-epimerase, UDP-hydrolysing [Gillisia limnaea DSM 15749]